jgi:putative phosphoesterase
MLIAAISDTHALLRPELLDSLRQLAPDHILHAGDVGNPDILTTLAKIAPVTAIRGNIDIHGPCADLPATETLELDGCLIHILHDVHTLDIHPHAAGIGLVLSGHSHQPSIAARDGLLYLNPGSCGPRRFNLPVTFARVQIFNGIPTAEIVSIPV